MNQTNQNKLYTLKEACELLSISLATGRNWMKAGRLISVAPIGQKPLFSEDALHTLKAELLSGNLSLLKGRRNKTYINGQASCNSYIAKESESRIALLRILTILQMENITLTEKGILCLLRDCAEKLLRQVGEETFSLCHDLLEDLVPEAIFSVFKETLASLCSISYYCIEKEDTLGFLYLSLCNIKDRKASGSYYTPAWLAERLVTNHLPEPDSSKKILDPSCGTGIFLLQLPDNIPLQNLYGNDLNPLSVTLTRLNLAMKYQISTKQELELLYHNITVSDFLKACPIQPAEETDCYDVILGNPPWGAKLSPEEKNFYRTRFHCASVPTPETFDLFIEQSINKLSDSGFLAFVLPEALLTVKAHSVARELLLRHASIHSVEYLGEVFDQVNCPSILLTAHVHTERPFFQNVHVTTKSKTFSTQVEHFFSADSFSFALTDNEYLLLQKLSSHPDCTTLADHADFALGIVTGNNAALIQTTQAPGLEPVIKGSDISKYHINSHSGYLAFLPEQFQQTAPEHFYRAPEKLLYRFINKQLIFTYDNTGLLSLNSCNILIPHLEGLSIKYILAVLNSGVAQFIFEKKFNSIKVLRSHLEQLPIPLADSKTQGEIIRLVDTLMQSEESSSEYQKAFMLLEQRIANLYDLTTEEYRILKEAVAN